MHNYDVYKILVLNYFCKDDIRFQSLLLSKEAYKNCISQMKLWIRLLNFNGLQQQYPH